MALDKKTLKKALARRELDRRNAKPAARLILSVLREWAQDPVDPDKTALAVDAVEGMPDLGADPEPRMAENLGRCAGNVCEVLGTEGINAIGVFHALDERLRGP